VVAAHRSARRPARVVSEVGTPDHLEPGAHALAEATRRSVLRSTRCRAELHAVTTSSRARAAACRFKWSMSKLAPASGLGCAANIALCGGLCSSFFPRRTGLEQAYKVILWPRPLRRPAGPIALSGMTLPRQDLPLHLVFVSTARLVDTAPDLITALNTCSTAKAVRGADGLGPNMIGAGARS